MEPKTRAEGRLTKPKGLMEGADIYSRGNLSNRAWVPPFDRIWSGEDFITTFRDMACFATLVSELRRSDWEGLWGLDDSG